MKSIYAISKKFKTVISILFFAFVYTHSAVAQYTLTDDDVIITNGVIQECFYSYEQTDIIIPEQLQDQTVTGIVDGSDAFHGVFGWKGITSLQLPKTIEYIGNYSLRDNEFTTIDLSACDKLTYIGAESLCRNPLESIDFKGCTSLERIEGSAFRACYLTEVDLSACVNLEYIGYSAFRDNSIISVDITGCTKLKTIAMNVFRSNVGLAGFVLPNVETPGYELDYWEVSITDYESWHMAAGDSATSLNALYKAVMKLATYTITYNTDGGVHSNPTEYTMEADTIFLSDASKEGYNFVGWYDNAEFTDDVVTEIPTGSYGDIELWAKYDIIVTTYNITYNVDGGTHNNPATYTNVENVMLTDAVKTDYKFMGWYDNAEFTGDVATEIAEGTSGDLEFWAKFEEGSGVSDDNSVALTMYPNPVSSNLTINLNNSNVETINILNAIGQQVYSCSPNSTQTSIDFSNFQQGIYYVIIATNDGNQMIEKIIRSN